MIITPLIHSTKLNFSAFSTLFLRRNFSRFTFPRISWSTPTFLRSLPFAIFTLSFLRQTKTKDCSRFGWIVTRFCIWSGAEIGNRILCRFCDFWSRKWSLIGHIESGWKAWKRRKNTLGKMCWHIWKRRELFLLNRILIKNYKTDFYWDFFFRGSESSRQIREKRGVVIKIFERENSSRRTNDNNANTSQDNMLFEDEAYVQSNERGRTLSFPPVQFTMCSFVCFHNRDDGKRKKKKSRRGEK